MASPTLPSPFAAKLGTNYCPTDAEVRNIEALLVRPTQLLQRLGDEISKLQTVLNKLVDERDALQAHVDAHKALISPVRRLPLDIIQEVFLACLPANRDCVMSASEAPLLLGRICRSWRTISQSTPRLWASLHVVEPSRRAYDRNPISPFLERRATLRLAATRTWLDRSGQCPLSLSLHSAPEYEDTPEDATEHSMQFVRMFVAFAPRWRDVVFTTPVSLVLEVLSHLETKMPLLQSVAFKYCRHRILSVPINCGSFAMLRGARISKLTMPGSIFVPDRLPVAWHQLTELVVGGPTGEMQEGLTDSILRVISRCPGLRCCKLVVSDLSIDIPPDTLAHVELPFLHTLAIRCASSVTAAVSVILNHLSVPELREFTLLGSSRESPSLATFFAGLEYLESVDIEGNLFSKPGLHETLRCLPPIIKRLKVRDVEGGWDPEPPTVDEDALVVLATPGLCPNLEEFAMDNEVSISDEAVLEFITKRMQTPSTTLKQVKIQFRRHVLVDVMPNLQPFVDNCGLKVELNYMSLPFWQFSPWAGLADAPPQQQRITNSTAWAPLPPGSPEW
ncbi:hypothetical protein R3P38DRAFT_3069123 [Favolaschia claudopus]|uniref:F-box domain-containing protein n=1 Tax=Favolaschia claudopus TaxID=2862362 RepID=A0AAW0A0L4_9AGAR